MNVITFHIAHKNVFGILTVQAIVVHLDIVVHQTYAWEEK
jgi:hypothetical protein